MQKQQELTQSAFECTSLVPPGITLLQVWNINSAKLEASEYKQIMQRYSSEIEIYDPVNLVTDLRDFGFNLPLELRKWHVSLLYGMLFRSKVRYIGIIRPQDKMTEIVIRDVLNRDRLVKIKTKYFDTMETCFDWLNKLYAI